MNTTPDTDSQRDDRPSGPSFSSLMWTDPSQRIIWGDRAILLVVLLCLFIPLLGSFGLWDPWETHYGEVGRQLIERHDWISTWWGSHWKNAAGGQEGSFFFSKPILLMWTMAMGLDLFGFSEWSIRLGTALTAIATVIAGYTGAEKIWGRRAGLLMSLVLATSPFFFFLSHQAQTDMPFVGHMSIGLFFFMAAMFGRDRNAPATKLSVSLLIVLTAAVVVPQLVLIFRGLIEWRAGPNIPTIGAFFSWGPTLSVIFGALAVGAIVTLVRSRDLTNKRVYFLTFYIFVALASLAKGLLGFALPGAFIFFFLLMTGSWRRLREVELLRGIALFIAVGFPWYVAMLIRHGNAFYQRFFVHDHFKRLATGVHQIDTGSFEHFVKWLGYGMWPWVALLPVAIIRLWLGRTTEEPKARHHAAIFVLIWATFAFTLFTLSSTKFHHYIFPAVPACALLVVILLNDLTSREPNTRLVHQRSLSWILYALVVGVFVSVGWDLIADPQNLKNLFTYKYDRKWNNEWTAEFQLALAGLGSIGLVGTLLLVSSRLKVRMVAIGLMGAMAIGLTAWSLMVYMPTISKTWSQKGVWDTYYATCTRSEGPPGGNAMKRYCHEQVLSYKLNWRGETFYTQNEVIPIREDEEFDYFIKNNKGERFYAVMEWSRYNGEFKRKLPQEFKGKACKVYSDNIKFVLAEVPCSHPDAPR